MRVEDFGSNCGLGCGKRCKRNEAASEDRTIYLRYPTSGKRKERIYSEKRRELTGMLGLS
jgi:hypothetical protein